MIINSEGGSGKSVILLKTCTMFLMSIMQWEDNQNGIYCLPIRAPLHSQWGITVFVLPFSFLLFSKSTFSVPLTETKTGQSKLKRMEHQFKDVPLVIIDELSMVSCGMLCRIDRRMGEIWPSHSNELFGGRDVYFTGDAAQLIVYFSGPLQRTLGVIHRLHVVGSKALIG